MTKRDPGRCVLYTDGGSRGNPGPAGSGIVLFAPGGETICSGGRFIGEGTNNVAEYDGLLWGLEVARDRGCTSLEVRMDSELIIRQMTGRYRVKNEGLKPLFAAARALLSDFEEVRFVHVPREENTEADSLANEAMDACAVVGDTHSGGYRTGMQDSLF